MIRIHRLFVLSIVLSIGIYSCQKELSDPNGLTTTPGGTGDFRAKINGVQWVASISGASRVNGNLSLLGSGGGKQIIITMIDSGVHHYTLDQIALNAGAYSDSASGSIDAFTTNCPLPTAGGSVDVTSIDTAHKTVSGTFRFTVIRALDSALRTITEGSFTNLPYGTTVNPGSSTDTFQVKINGIDWPPFAIHGTNITLLNQITLSGTDQNGVKTVNILVPNTITPGSYAFTGITGAEIGQYNPDASTYLVSDSGSLSIIEHNLSTKRIRGNFSFHAKQFVTGTIQAQLTAGYFAITYQ